MKEPKKFDNNRENRKRILALFCIGLLIFGISKIEIDNNRNRLAELMREQTAKIGEVIAELEKY